MRLTYTFLSITVILLFVLGCYKEKGIPINNISGDDIKHYRELALINGDTSAYHQLSLDYMDSPYDGFLYHAMIMANKHDYHQAYADVYYCLTDHHHKADGTELNNLDDKTRTLALDYLNLGAEKGNKECKKILGKLYLVGKYIKKDH